MITSSTSLMLLPKTLWDIGVIRLQRRLSYEVRQRIDKQLPVGLALSWAGYKDIAPAWNEILSTLAYTVSAPQKAEHVLQSIEFFFLNKSRKLTLPICWENQNWNRLWQFHLHYFDWIRSWLDVALISGEWPSEASALEALIDDWIRANQPGRGDGWHSYTLSLRTRNWVWLFRLCPVLAVPQRLTSLWQQLLWLQAHPESCHGGNHWLENLTALALGGLQFEGSEAAAMHERAMKLLQKELARQVLSDGGHEERSASYHLLVLDRLVELAFALHMIKNIEPTWLVSNIKLMTAWIRSIRLKNGDAPRFNDYARDATAPLDEILNFAEAYLQLAEGNPDKCIACYGFRGLLIETTANVKCSKKDNLLLPHHSQPIITDLSSTGWTFLRPGHGWELTFKCGVPCPAHLPAHVHSDQLSFELSYHGQLILAEAGTSIYGNNHIRSYERSGQAHNVLQLGYVSRHGRIKWVEPVEVWGNFRAARKAQPIQRNCGALEGGGCFVEGKHDGFNRIKAEHKRMVVIKQAKPETVNLVIEDLVLNQAPLHFRQWWHLAPGLSQQVLSSLNFECQSARQIKTHWHKTLFANGFGNRSERSSFSVTGCLPAGENRLRVTIPVSNKFLQKVQTCQACG